MGMFNREFKIALHVDDYDPVLFFYREALGLLPNYTWYIDDDDRGARFYLGDAKLEILHRKAPAKQGPSSFMVQSTDVDACFAIMRTFPGIAVLEEPANRPWGARSFLVRDPAGNVAEVMQYEKDLGKKADAARETIFDKELTALLFTKDLEAAARFYGEVLGLERLSAWDDGPDDRGVRFKAGRGYIELLSRPAKTAGGPGMLALEADNVNVCFNTLKKQGVPVLDDLRDVFTGQRLFRLRDPDGNVVEIYSELEDIRDLKVEAAE